MNTDELTRIGHKLYGSNRGWRKKIAAILDIDPATLRRWMDADCVPESAAIALRLLGKKSREVRMPGTFITVSGVSM